MSEHTHIYTHIHGHTYMPTYTHIHTYIQTYSFTHAILVTWILVDHENISTCHQTHMMVVPVLVNSLHVTQPDSS